MTEINGARVDKPKFINIIIPMYNLIEYSDNYSDTSGCLWDFKRDEINADTNVCTTVLHLNTNRVSWIIQKQKERKME